MKITWNFLGRGGCKTKKTSRGGTMDIFWDCTIEKKEVDQNNIIIIRPFKKKIRAAFIFSIKGIFTYSVQLIAFQFLSFIMRPQPKKNNIKNLHVTLPYIIEIRLEVVAST